MESDIREQFTETKKEIYDLGRKQRKDFEFLLAQIRNDDRLRDQATREWRLKTIGWGAGACCVVLIARIVISPTVRP